MKDRKFRPSRHYFREDMAKLGIENDLDILLDNLSLGEFLKSAPRTYLEPSIEFFSTFEFNKVGETDFIISFQLFNVKHTMNLAEFNVALGFNPNGDIFEPLISLVQTEYNEVSWWKTIANRREFDLKKSLLGYSVFNKKDLGKLSREEIMVL